MEKLQLKNYIDNVAQQQHVSVDEVIGSLKEALAKAYMKEYPEEKCEINIDYNSGQILLNKIFDVVDDNKEDLNEYCEIPLTQAQALDSSLKVGDVYKINFDINTLERRVVVHMLQVFRHNISIKSNKVIYQEWLSKKGTIITGEVEKIDQRSRGVLVKIGETYGFMPYTEANHEEKLQPSQSYRFYIKNVIEQTKGWPIVLSRASGELIKELLINNIPEIQDKIIEIVKVARVAGFKTKVVVKSNSPEIDPVGSCIGQRGDRIRPILNQLGKEKIEFVQYDEAFEKFVVNACTPVPLIGYKIEQPAEEGKLKDITLIVHKTKLALIIGLQGKNVRLLSQLLEANVDIMTYDEALQDHFVFERVAMNNRDMNYSFGGGRENAGRRSDGAQPNRFAYVYNKYQSKNRDILNQIEDEDQDSQPEQTPSSNIEIQKADLSNIQDNIDEMEKIIDETTDLKK